MKSLWMAWRLTASLLGSQRKLWLPFVMTAIVEVFLIVLIWLAPQVPFSAVLAPPIRYFFGDRVLHYPAHLWFLYRAMKHTNLVASLMIGAFMSGVACAMVRQTHENTTLSLRDALVTKQVPYGRIFLLWVLSWGIANGVLHLVSHYAPKNMFMMWVSLGLTVVLQTLLVYVVPAGVFEGTTWWKAFFRGVRESCRYPISTLITVIVPCAVVILFAFLASPTRVAQLMMRTTPEIAILFVLARLLVWTLVDTCLTVSVAHLWWVHRQREASAEAVRSSEVPQVSRKPLQEAHVLV